MGIKKFIATVIESLELDEFENTGKKKSVKRLLEKLKARKEMINNIPKKKLDTKKKKDLKEELAIVTLQIKKGENILDELNKTAKSKKPKNKKEK